MSYFAQVINNRVLKIIAVEQEVIDSGLFGEPLMWMDASYLGTISKNFPSIGYSYDAMRDAFIPPKPFSSWLLDETTCQWVAPIAMPQDGLLYDWNETTKSWIVVEPV